jgi:serine/threonine-protein kinase HipA
LSLDVCLYGERVGTLFPAGDNDYRLAYDPELVERVGPGKALLSNSLPARPEPYSGAATRAYVEGLLPEGPRRERLGRELGVDPADGYKLLVELGRDCPGGVTFVPAGQAAGTSDGDSTAWLSGEELEAALKQPQRGGSEGDRATRFTLPGLRHKLALVRDGEGERWAWPGADRPSTHVIKPETGEYPEYVANEMFCTTVARQVGLPVAKAGVEEIAGRRCLVSPRYDRVVGEAAEGVKRLHCESFCQALGISPAATAADRDGDGLGWAEARGLMNAVSRPDEVVHLLTAAFCNYILGNGDAHGKNFALLDREKTSLDGPERKWRLAPLTDLTSTVVYDDPIHHGLTISEEYQETSYLLELAEVCEACAFDFEVMRGLAATTAARVGMAIETIATRAKKEGWHQPIVDKIVELAADRSFGLGAEVEY